MINRQYNSQRPAPAGRPGQTPLLIENRRDELRVLSVSLDLDTEYWLDLPVIAWEVDVSADSFIADVPITLADLTGDARAIHDRSTGFCYSPAEVDWCGALPLAEARERLLEVAREAQARHH
ncbi:MAG: hypothetical protein IT487_17420 [Chromatiaceae bacterium]|nr:hypothetical protein [Chromatiaceae bacterium]